MLGGDRMRTTAFLSRLFYIFVIIQVVATTEYGVPIEIKLWDSKRAPLAHMVDVTNEFGIKVLAEHNFLNDNNIAFSPYGLIGILVSLYEGVDGESSYQIQRSMQLPWNRNVMRIGFRDIHRTLKTYFVPEEGFLAGLALNNENVTFTDTYKKILRFYGFDLDSEQTPTSSTNVSNDMPSTAPTTDSASNINDSTTVTTESITQREDSSTIQSTVGTKEETTLNPNAETINDLNMRDPNTETTSSMTPTTPTESPSTTDPNSTGEQVVSTQSMISTTSTIDSTTQTDTTTQFETTVTTNSPTSSTSISSEPAISTTDGTIFSTNIETITSIITNTGAVSTVDTSTLDGSNTETTESEMKSTSFADTQQTVLTSTMMNSESTTTEASSPATTTSTLETLERRKKSVADYLFTGPPAPYGDDYLVYRSFDIGPELPEENIEGDTMFLVNGLRNIQVTYMQYDSMLEHAYLPHLEASALRLPLDSERYYLLVVLPSRRGAGELSRLLARMARESDLSDVYAALRPRRVRAVVPSFTVKGHVALTTDLQKLGIRDVFEPRQHDFSPMTPQPGVYVRSIEQAVSVAIRKYQPDDIKNRYAGRGPVYFAATYPFLYFVMDANIHVALMAGKMVDPLNTRIL